MLHAAAMLTGLCMVWLLLTQQWHSPTEMIVAVGAAFIAATCAARLGGIGGAFARAPLVLVIAVSRLGAVLGGASATVRAALAADITMKPGLVRMRTKANAAAQAVFADLVSAVPGIVVVETGTEGLLAHTINEDTVAPEDFSLLEARVLNAVGGTT